MNPHGHCFGTPEDNSKAQNAPEYASEWDRIEHPECSSAQVADEIAQLIANAEQPEEKDRIGEILAAVEGLLTLFSIIAAFSVLSLLLTGAVLYNVLG